jgi:hypothetical protein
MPTHRSLFLGIFLIFAASVQAPAQGRSPLLDKIVASVRTANPKWHFIPGVCTCPRLVQSQSAYAFGGWHLGKLTSRRRVSIYISYVPTSTSAADWMADLGRRNVVTGWRREHYAFADEAYLWTSNTGYAYLYFRNGSLVVEVSGALDDVKFFAPHAYLRMAPDNKSLDASGGSVFLS